MPAVSLETIVFDPKIYPRRSGSPATVSQYADAIAAGDVFPPIVLEPETNRLLDGWHRWQAHKQLGLDEIEVAWREVPNGIPPKLYAASLSVKHGDRIKGEELKQIARDIVTSDASYNINTVAKYCGVTRQTASNWVRDIVDYRRHVRRVCAAIMSESGMTQQAIADHLDMSQKQVSDDVKSDILTSVTESMLRDATDQLPDTIDAAAIIENLRQEQIFASWSAEQLDLLKRLREGETIVVSLRDNRHVELIEWATDAGIYERVDRQTKWGNPFEMGPDGDRDTVIANYRAHYLPHKPSLTSHIKKLRGKALGCWCAPEPCHADVLRDLAEQ